MHMHTTTMYQPNLTVHAISTTDRVVVVVGVCSSAFVSEHLHDVEMTHISTFIFIYIYV